ncbi:sensor histidine kinase [Nonomuraea sp. NPDC050556]|uniref:sensor histidine kinase n=1 Tax=Nonomuraea sp. NPDC050556 TaxID=3364369 RepID=UPI00379C8772
MSDFPLLRRIVDDLKRLPPLVIDLALTIGALVAQSAPYVSDERAGTWTPLQYLPILVATLPILARRRFPLISFLVILLGMSSYDWLGRGMPSQPNWYAFLIATYTIAERSPFRIRMGVIVLTVVGSVIGSGSFDTLVRGLVSWAGAYAIGRAAAMHRERLVMRQQEATERERTRIAREMHDILAHAVSVMVVQAEAGPLAVRTKPERAEAAFDAIAAAGRDAMGQLRRMLGLLKEEEGVRDPQPTLDRLPELVARVDGATLVVTGEPVPIGQDIELAAYRIVQESLTNTVKHAGAGEVEVRLDWKDNALTITVTDDGNGTSANLSGGGHGLIGIRERAAACGGTATFGQAPGGRGFRVSVRLPA